MSDSHTWNHTPARRPAPPAPTLIRALWIVTKTPNRSVTAGIYENPYGVELRVYYAGDVNNIIMTELSRVGDGPLECRASELRRVLEDVGWTAAT